MQDPSTVDFLARANMKPTGTFWMVWVEGTEGTRKRYEVMGDAEVEAERLAKQTGKLVYLLQSVKFCQVPARPVEWGDIP